ncbi:MAG: putative NEK protein kinase [Streblomastix strix]|uniref:non-specific serine/threonine protein kinase n=1 Tax=Streblomastix strix TaxID=222440 RepID=A0A5J4WU08_9EUKA|nr:MAG: putative NEK protein kinase [Streblomastix strix]
MAQANQLFKVIKDYAGLDGDLQFIPVTKGEIVLVIKKEIEYYTIEKNSQIGKVPQEQMSVNTTVSSWHNLLFETPAYEDFDIMKKLSGGAMGKTFLVRLIWGFTERSELFMITDYCELGDLKKVIKDLQSLPKEERLNHVWALFAQIIKAVDFMHSLDIIHRDIKPANIFIMEDGTARLGDFGLAEDISKDGFATVAGTLNYQAAEVWTLGKMNFSSDVFSVGVIIYELITGQYPFAASSNNEIIKKIQKGEFQPLPFWVPIELKDIITAMTKSNALQLKLSWKLNKSRGILRYLKINKI